MERPITMSRSGPVEDSIVFAEIAEFARSLITVPKGQELPFSGLPQLLPYKLYRAWWAAELGEQDLAKRYVSYSVTRKRDGTKTDQSARYCTAVESASKAGKNGPPLLSRSHLNSLEDLQERLTGEPSIKPANLFGARKQGPKPGVNKLGSWIEGRLTKFIAGEEDNQGPFKADLAAKAKGKESSAAAPVGPFSHFSTISPGPSNPVTRRPSTADVRNGSLNIDHDSRRTSPSIGHHQSSPSSSSSQYGGDQYAARGAAGGYGGYQPYAPDEAEADEATPHALEPSGAGDDDDVELLNPMAAMSLGAARQTQDDYAPSQSHRRDEPDDDEDDLGFGNSGLSRNRTPMPVEGSSGSQAAGTKEEPARAAVATPAAASQSESLPMHSMWVRADMYSRGTKTVRMATRLVWEKGGRHVRTGCC